VKAWVAALLLSAAPDAGTKAPPSSVEPTGGIDEQVVNKVPALQQHLLKCAAAAFKDKGAPHGCLPVLIAQGPKGELQFTLDRERPSLNYEEGEKCLRTYAGPKPAMKKGAHLRYPVCF